MYFIAATSSVSEYKKITADIVWNASTSVMDSKIKAATGWSNTVVRKDLDATGQVTTDSTAVAGYEWIVTYDWYKSKDVNPLV